MTVAYSDFVTAFPEFANTATYPESQIDFWIGQAVNQINACRFGSNADFATMLFVAHNIVLSARSAAATAGGAIAGDASGPVTSKTVGPVSKSMDAALVGYAGAGPYNQTSYGQRLYQIMRAAGTGPMYFPKPVQVGPWGPGSFGQAGPFGIGWGR